MIYLYHFETEEREDLDSKTSEVFQYNVYVFEYLSIFFFFFNFLYIQNNKLIFSPRYAFTGEFYFHSNLTIAFPKDFQ